MPGSDLLWWIIGGVLALAGLPLCVWALWADRLSTAGRNPSRRRCPRCWHDLRATPGLTCPECGHVAKSEWTLRRRRRRWRAVMMGVAALIVAVIAALVPAGRAGQLWRHVPTTLLVGVKSIIGSRTWPRLTMESVHRLSTEDLWDWQIRSIAGGYGRAWHFYRETWPEGSQLWAAEFSALTHHSWWFDDMDQLRQMDGPSHEMVWDPALAPIRDSTHARFIRVTLRFDTPGRRYEFLDLPIRRVPTIDEAITPVREPALDAAIAQTLQPRLVHMEYRDALVLVVREPTFTSPDIAVGIRVTFEYDGTVRATARMFTRTTTTVGDILPGVLLEGEYAALVELKNADASDPRWQVRIQGDGEMALRDFGAARYWSGELTLPLSAVKK